MPVHLAQAAGPNRNQSGGNCGRNGEVAAVGDPYRTALRLARRGCRSKREGERVRWRALSANRCAVRGEVAGQLALEDVEVAKRDILERVDRNTEVFGEDIRRRMREPFRTHQGGKLRSLAFIEADEELAAVRAEPLQRMRQAGGEIPEVSLFHVGDIRPAQFVESGDAARAVGHVSPLCKLVPVHFPNAAGGQPHVDAGDGVRNRKGVLRYLTRPTAILNASRRVVE